MKTILFWLSYFAVSVAANLLESSAGVHNWQLMLSSLGSDSACFFLLRSAIEPHWWRPDYKTGWFRIR